MTSHYETLGVPTDATPEQIKAARRRRASEAHPDKGGSDDEMQRVNRAYEVLSDPERRATYDSTGSDGAPAKPPIEEEARQVLHQLIDKAIENDENIVALVRQQISRAAANMAGIVSQANRKIARFEKRRARISTKAGAENIAHRIIDAKIAKAKHDIAQAENLGRVNEHLSALIEAYTDEQAEDGAGTVADAIRFATWGRAR